MTKPKKWKVYRWKKKKYKIDVNNNEIKIDCCEFNGTKAKVLKIFDTRGHKKKEESITEKDA